MPRNRRTSDGPKQMMNPNSLRNLPQYRDLPDEVWTEKLAAMNFGNQAKIDIEASIEQEYKKYEDAYDLSDMMPNDIATLRALILAHVRLVNYEILLNQLESMGISDANILVIDKISNICDKLRGQMSSLQDTLKISRKVRKSEKEQSVIAFIDDLKLKAKTFYDAKMIYLLCPKDNNTLGTLWLQNADSSKHVVKLFCNRCKEVHSFNMQEIHNAKKASNLPNQLPESMR